MPATKVANANSEFVPVLDAIAPWVRIGAVDYLKIVDANPIRTPGTQISSSTREIISRLNRPARTLWVRARYTAGGALVDYAIIKVFGRASSADDWQILLNGATNNTARLTPDTSADVLVDSGANALTTVGPSEHAFDTQGCSEFLIGVEQALGMNPSASTGALEVRFT